MRFHQSVCSFFELMPIKIRKRQDGSCLYEVEVYWYADDTILGKPIRQVWQFAFIESISAKILCSMQRKGEVRERIEMAPHVGFSLWQKA